MNAWVDEDCERALTGGEWIAGLLTFALFVALAGFAGWITGGPM